MWILKYSYELEDGTKRCVSSCLINQQSYSIGRSSKNLLNIKNDKSISRNHMSVIWNSKDGLIRLFNQGKLTAAGGKYLKVGESMNFEAASHINVPIRIELGTKPIVVQIIWRDVVIDIPHQLLKFTDTLDNLGIGVRVDTADSHSTTIVVSEDRAGYAPKNLFGLINGISIRSSHFLAELASTDFKGTSAFEEIWDSLMKNSSYVLSPNGSTDEHKDVFKGYKFYLVGGDDMSKDYVQQAIKAGSGELVILENSLQLLHSLRSEVSVEKVIALALSPFSLRESTNSIHFHTLQDIERAVKSSVLPTLLGGVSLENQPTVKQDADHEVRRAGSSGKIESLGDEAALERPDEAIQKPPTKRRRLNRPKVKPLDSLMFFAGGDFTSKDADLEASTQPANLSISNEVTSVSTASVNEENGSSSRIGVQTDSPAQEASRHIEATYQRPPESVVVSQSNTPFAHEGAHHTEQIHQSLTADQERNERQAESANETISKEEPVDNSTRPGGRKKTLQNFKSTFDDSNKADSITESLVDVIKDTKRREVKRLTSTLVQVDSVELTEDAINKLGNLAIVQPNDSLLRHGKKDETGNLDKESSQPWRGRKNFKNFVKIQPKYKQHRIGGSSREGSSDFIRNSAYLLTRQYVPSKVYKDDASVQHRGFFDVPELEFGTARSLKASNVDETRAVEQSTSPYDLVSRAPNSGLFVVDEDDSQNVAATLGTESGGQEVNVELSNPPSGQYPLKRDRKGRRYVAQDNSFHSRDEGDDDDDDDDEPKFKFSRRFR